MRSRVSTVLARHGLPGKLFGGVRGAGNLIGGLTQSLRGSVSAGAVLAGALTVGAASPTSVLLLSDGASRLLLADGVSRLRLAA